MPPWLPHDAILRLHAAVVEAQLTVPQRRGLMLRFLDRAFAASLETLDNPYDQLLSDLEALNKTGMLADGTVPLRRWLEFAITLTQPRNEHEPFEVALALLAVPQPANPQPPEQPSAPLPRIIVFAAHSEEDMLLLSEQVKALLTPQRQAFEIVVADLASEGARSLVKPNHLRVVLLGASTGGQRGEALVRELLREPKHLVAAALEPIAPERRRAWRAELLQRDDLVEEIGGVREVHRFALNEEAAATLRDPILRALEALAPKRGQDSAVLTEGERRYIDGQSSGWRDGRSDGLVAMAKRCTLHREPLYVSLHAHTDRWVRKKESEEAQEGERIPIFLDELLSHPSVPHAVIVGEAGTGKTVLLLHIAWSLRCHHRGQPLPEECRLDLEALRGERSLLPVPVLLEARRVAEAITKDGKERVFERMLADAFGLPDPSPEVQEGLRQGRYLLLVDSLDEVPGITGRERVTEALKSLPECSGCRVILTTRPTAHTAVTVPSPYERIDIAPLDDERREALIARWKAAKNLDADAARKLPGTLSALSARFPRDERNQSPLENPLLLTCVLLVFIEQERLPNNTAELYERMVQHLCDRRPEDPSAAEQTKRQSATRRRGMLAEVGIALQESGTTALPARTLCARLVREGETIHDAERVLDELAVTTGLFRFEQEGKVQVVRPWHRSFQEYLAACAIAGRTGSEAQIAERLWDSGILSDPGWEDALRFVVGAFGVRTAGTERARGFVDALVALAEREAGNLREGRLLGLAATGVAEYRDEHFLDVEPASTLRARIAEQFAANGARWPWKDRLLALSALGRLPGGDPRLPDPRTSGEGWVEIPAGTYTIGGDAEAFQSLPSQQVPVGRFFLRAWPVTVSEYSAFLQDEPGEEPLDWSAQVHQPNIPVTGVSWHQARAFCRFASGAWQHRPEGTLDLPDSHEWEIAARRAHGGPYPWGKEEPGEGDNARANYEWGPDLPRRATPVGMFPLGNAGALLDMAGNVWEWCASTFGEKHDMPCHLQDNECHVDDRSDGAPRVLRGGSWWLLSPGDLRVTNRRRDHPGGPGPELRVPPGRPVPQPAGWPLIFDLRRAASIATFLSGTRHEHQAPHIHRAPYD